MEKILKNKINEIKKTITETCTTIFAIHHSKNKQYGEKGLLVFAGIVLAMALYLGSFLFFNLLDIPKGLEMVVLSIYKYTITVGIWMSAFSLSTYFYIYGKGKIHKWISVAYIFAYALTAVVLIPILLFILFVNRRILNKARRIENVISLLLIFIFDLLISIICISVESRCLFSMALYTWLSKYLSLKDIPVFICFIIVIPYLMIRIFNYVAVSILIFCSKRKIEKEKKAAIDKKYKQFQSTDNIMELVETTNKIAEEIENSGNKELRYDKTYILSGLNVLLIVGFILLGYMATFLDVDWISPISTDVLNVITCISLISLIKDSGIRDDCSMIQNKKD